MRRCRGFLSLSAVLSAIVAIGGLIDDAFAADRTPVEHVLKRQRPAGKPLETTAYTPSDAERTFFDTLDAKERAVGKGTVDYKLDEKGRKFVGWFGIVRQISEDAKLGQTVLTIEHKYFDGLTDAHILAVSFNGGGDFRAVLQGVGHEIARLSLVKVYGVPVGGGENGLPRIEATFVRDWHWGAFAFLSAYGTQKGNVAWQKLNTIDLKHIYAPYPAKSYYEKRLGKRTADDPLYRRLLKPAGKLTPEAKALMIELIDSLQADNLGPVMQMSEVVSKREEKQAGVTVLLAAIRDDEIPSWSVPIALGRLAGPDELRLLIAMLDDVNCEVRARTVSTLMEMDKKAISALPALAKALRDAEPRVRSTAANALGVIGVGASAAVEPLKESLKDRDTSVRVAAAEALWYITFEAEPLIPVFVDALKDADPDVRWAAARALEPMGPAAASAGPALIAASKDDNDEVRWSAVVALGSIQADPKTVLPALTAALKDKDSSVRGQAADALGKYGVDSQAVVQTLVAALKDEDGNVRWFAVKALGEIGPAAAKAIPALIDALQHDDDENVRLFSATAIGSIDVDGRTAIPTLIEAMSDRASKVRHSTIVVLGKMGPNAKAALPGLRTAIKDDDEAVRIVAAESLWRIDRDADAAMPVLLDALKGGKYRGLAANAIGTIGPKAKSAVPLLIKLLSRTEDRVAAGYAAEALGNIGPDAAAAVPGLIELLRLREGFSPCAVEAAEALWKINRHPRAIATLVELLRADNGMVPVAEALGRIGPGASEAISALREVAKHRDPEIRYAAVEALRRVEGKNK